MIALARARASMVRAGAEMPVARTRMSERMDDRVWSLRAKLAACHAVIAGLRADAEADKALIAQLDARISLILAEVER